MPSDLLGGSRRADARANHLALVDAAAALVGRRGVDVPYDEIALAAGVGRATVYRHFPTRETLIRAIIDAALERWAAVVAQSAAGPNQLEALLRAWVCEQRGRSPGVDLLTYSAPEEDLRRARRRFEATLSEPLRLAQAAGRAKQELSCRDLRIVLTMLAACLRAPESASDRRRAVELAQGLIFGAPPGR